MQHFILFLGHPIYALSVVLFVLLLASGLGSYSTRKVEGAAALRTLGLGTLALAALVGLYAFLLGPLFGLWVGLPLFARIGISLALLAAPGLLMGRLMPLAIKVLTRDAAVVIPWAWGINGAASVLGSVAAVALSMNLGYRVTQLIAAGIYLVGAGLLWLGSRTRIMPEVGEGRSP